MPWIAESDAPTYRFRPSGALEFQDRRGRYRLVYGCSIAGYFDFWDHYSDLQPLLTKALDSDPDMGIDHLYLHCDPFRYACDRCLELSGIDTDWIAPQMLAWLLFAHQSGETVIEAALVLLNRPAERKYPPLKGGSAVDSHTKLLSALVNAAGGDMAKAMELAEKLSARQFFGISEELGWQRADTKDKGKAWADKRIREMAERGQTSVLNPAEIAALVGKSAANDATPTAD
jgi:hypothetical protein